MARGEVTIVVGTLGALIEEIKQYSCEPPARWNDTELDALQNSLNRFGLIEVADAIGSLRFDLVDARARGAK